MMLYNIWIDLVKLAVTASVIIVITAFVRRRKPLVTPKPKRLAFRVDNIPFEDESELDHKIRSFLQQGPDLQRAVATMSRHSLMARDKHSVCATFSIITTIPGEKLCARLSQAGKDHPYSYSCRFDGITPLYGDKCGADVDILAVPGLGSHALGSWKSTTSDEVWLRDFLPKDLPNVRVLLYGYDTTLPGSFSKQSIADLGGGLLEQINAFRANDGTAKRPIVLIGHSLGGLLIKELLIRARRRRSTADSDLSKACFGLLFFGVPNLGLRNEQLRTLVQGQPNKALIDDLLVDNDSEPSTFLKRLAGQFSESCKGYYRVVTFFERVLSPTLELAPDGKWSKTGRPSLLVTEKSATSTGLGAVVGEDNIALNTDHSGLVKYSYRSQGDYPIVRERLRRLVSEAKAEVVKRFAEPSLSSTQLETIQRCLKSLAFLDMDRRLNEVEKAAEGTCRWILRHEALVKWTHQQRGLLWIKGKPGSGKSTLMKYAFQERPVYHDKMAISISFFFHGRGHQLQKSPVGLYRSLLHQLLDRMPDVLLDMLEYFENQRKKVSEPEDKWKWELQILQDFFERSLARLLKKHPVVVYVDALDECGEHDAVETIGYLKRLLFTLPPTNFRFSICFSCRHYPLLELHESLTILLDTANQEDIAIYIRSRFSASQEDSQLVEQICHRAQGVFMWAHLVAERAIRMRRQGNSNKKIKAEIKKVPGGLNDLYHDLIQGIEEPQDSLTLMQWICFSDRPLTSDELSWAMTTDSWSTGNSLEECYHSNDFVANEVLERRTINLSCGLIEFVPSETSRVVQFIHQSVKDFFIEGGLLLLDGTKSVELMIPAAHCRLSRSCIYYIKMAVNSRSRPLKTEDFSNLPLLEYATTSWMSHTKLGEKAESSPNELLDHFGWPKQQLIESWINIYQEIQPFSDTSPSRGSDLVHLAAIYGLTKLLRCILNREGTNLESKDSEYGQTPLSWAARNGNHVELKMLLDTNMVDINSKDRNERTPILWAARNGHLAVVKILLELGGAVVDFKDQFAQTPLSWASRNGHLTVVETLLFTGEVNTNSKDKNGKTPLSWATEGKHEAVIKVLFDKGDANLNSKDNDGFTPLLRASRDGVDSVVEILLDTALVDTETKDPEFNRTPLSWAAERGYNGVAKALLEKGIVKINTKDINGKTPLILAARNGHLSVIEMLLGTGKANIETKDLQYDQTALSWAAEKGHHHVVQELLHKGKADVNTKDKNGMTPLALAAERGHTAVVTILLSTGRTNVDCKDQNGKIPLMWAARNGYLSVIEMLLGTGKVDIETKDLQYDQTALSWAAEKGHHHVVQELLHNGKADVNTKDKNGMTPLALAAERGHTAVVTMLFSTGKANIDCKDQNGKTPLIWAARNGYLSVIEMLLGTGKVDIETKDLQYDQTALSWAAKKGHDRVVQELFHKGKADVNTKDKNGMTPLALAAEKGHTAVVTMLLSTGKANVDSKDQSGKTPLLWSVEKGQDDVAKLLLNTGKVDIDLNRIEINQAWLFWAARNGHIAMFRMLLDTGKICVEFQDNNGRTPFLLAVMHGHDAVVRILLDKGKAEFNTKDKNEMTPLALAAERGHTAIVTMLLSTGRKNVDCKDQNGKTPLIWAARNGYLSVIEILLETGKVDIETKDLQYDQTALSWAAEKGHHHVVQELLHKGKADVNTKDKNGMTPLALAAEKGHTAVVTMLLSTGKVHVDSKDHKEKTPLWWAIDKGHDDTVKILLETGKIDIDAKDKDEMTPLAQAAQKGHTAVVKMLLSIGKADVDLKDKNGKTPLIWAARNGHLYVIKILLKTGKVDIEAKDLEFDQTALSWAAENGHNRVVEELLDIGKACVESEDKNRQTPLLWAVKYGHSAVIRILLDKGKAEVNTKDKNGVSPLALAAEKGHTAVVTMLLSTGKVHVDSKDQNGKTPLWWAVEKGHDDVVQMLSHVKKV